MFLNKISPILFVLTACLISTGLDTKQVPSSSPFISPPSSKSVTTELKTYWNFQTRSLSSTFTLSHHTKPAKIHRVVAAQLILKLFCKFLLLAKSSAQAFQNVSSSLFSTEVLLSKKGFNFQHIFYF